ncbi:MAG: hypothetical protein JW969_06320, partial [Spirochaetales bacterium]|nr:hypothetical protein [Spirochaetales bacterium]
SGMLIPLKSYDLSMESEKIDIDVYRGFLNFDPDDKLDVHEYYYMEYHCSYVFRNTGENTHFLLGFPVKYGIFNEIDGSYGFSVQPSLSDCIIRIDGTNALFSRYIHGLNDELEEINYDEVYGFEAEIESGGEKSIEVFYTSLIGGDDSWTDEYRVEYILKSAQASRGNIGQSEIAVRFHFPVKTEINSSPGEFDVLQDDEDPYSTVEWNLKNILPSKDISIIFEPLDVKHPDYETAIERLNKEKSIASFYGLTNIIGEKNFNEYIIKKHKTTWKEMNIDKTKVNAALRRYYASVLNNPDISNIFAGFLIGDISKYTSRSPGKILMNNVKQKIGKQAGEEYSREITLIAAIDESLKEQPIQRELIERTAPFLHSSMFYFYLPDDNSFITQNEYIKQLSKAYKNSSKSDKSTSLEKTLKDAYIKTFNHMLLSEEDNAGVIINFANIRSNPVDFIDLYIRTITSATSTLWKGKGNHETKNRIEKLLGLLYQYNPDPFRSKDSNHLYPKLFYIFRALHSEKRQILRRAYYSLANYYFGKENFEKAIYNYKTGLAYCTTSPLFNYFSFFSHMGSTVLYWHEDGDGLEPESVDEYDWHARYNSTRAVMNGKAPYWKDLPNLAAPTGADITALYTPERLLALNLEKWEIEKENDAPCYYFAYNTACACSRFKKSEEALKWLTVALRLNGALAKLVPKDADLKFARDNNQDEVDRLIKKYGKTAK